MLVRPAVGMLVELDPQDLGEPRHHHVVADQEQYAGEVTRDEVGGGPPERLVRGVAGSDALVDEPEQVGDLARRRSRLASSRCCIRS